MQIILKLKILHIKNRLLLFQLLSRLFITAISESKLSTPLKKKLVFRYLLNHDYIVFVSTF